MLSYKGTKMDSGKTKKKMGGYFRDFGAIQEDTLIHLSGIL